MKDPERFSSLTLLVPATAWVTRAAKAAEYRAAADLIEQQGLAAFLMRDLTAPRPPATVDAPETVPDVTEELLPSLFRGAALSDLPDPEDVSGIDVPVTVLAWIDDPAHPVSTAETLVGLLPHAKLEIAHTPADLARWPSILCEDVARHG